MSKILIAGDFCQKHRVDGIVKEKRFGELFDMVKPIIQSSDYSIVNFEFPIVISPDRKKPIPKCGPNLEGTVEAIDAVKYAGFNCCTLANNHILDQGEQCCIDTKIGLEKSGIDTVGVGHNLLEAAKTLYKDIDRSTFAIINCCEHEFSIATESAAGANPLNPIQQYYAIKEAKKKADYVLVIIHGGHEHFQLPSPRMQETYRFFIDAGADAVVNHHQHCYSGYEIYNGKPIFYGLGNFCFDNPQKRNDIWNEGYMVELLFGEQLKFKIHPYNQCSGDATIKLLGRDAFDGKIAELNVCIADTTHLAERVDEYYSCCIPYEETVLEPYTNRVMRKLFSKGLLPKFIKGSKVTAVLNHVDCESHKDKLLYMLRHKIK